MNWVLVLRTVVAVCDHGQTQGWDTNTLIREIALTLLDRLEEQ